MLDAFKKAPLAHRTLHDVRDGRPENSVSGAKAAMAAGYGLEIDLQLSSDSVPMVFHDDLLQRLTRHYGKVRDHRFQPCHSPKISFGQATSQTDTCKRKTSSSSFWVKYPKPTAAP